MGTETRLDYALSKSVKDRTEIDHMIIIKEKFNGSVRDYLLSMGDFKDIPIEEENKNDNN